MIRTMTCCDQCDKECPYESIYAVVGTQNGVNGTEPRHEPVDLCPIHMWMLMAEMVADMGPAQAGAWVRRARTKRPAKRV